MHCLLQSFYALFRPYLHAKRAEKSAVIINDYDSQNEDEAQLMLTKSIHSTEMHSFSEILPDCLVIKAPSSHQCALNSSKVSSGIRLEKPLPSLPGPCGRTDTEQPKRFSYAELNKPLPPLPERESLPRAPWATSTAGRRQTYHASTSSMPSSAVRELADTSYSTQSGIISCRASWACCARKSHQITRKPLPLPPSPRSIRVWPTNASGVALEASLPAVAAPVQDNMAIFELGIPTPRAELCAVNAMERPAQSKQSMLSLRVGHELGWLKETIVR